MNYRDRWLLGMCYSYNTSIHSAADYTPAKLMFGCDFLISTDILYGTDDEKYHHVSLDSFAKQLGNIYIFCPRKHEHATSQIQNLL